VSPPVRSARYPSLLGRRQCQSAGSSTFLCASRPCGGSGFGLRRAYALRWALAGVQIRNVFRFLRHFLGHACETAARMRMEPASHNRFRAWCAPAVRTVWVWRAKCMLERGLALRASTRSTHTPGKGQTTAAASS